MELINFSKANCRSCYKCLRTCPVKAIRIKNDQAKIASERCVSCGQCLAACPQNARRIQSDLYKIKSAIRNGRKVAALLAPSFPGAFKLDNPNRLLTALKKLGLTNIEEVAVGAQLVTDLYNSYINEESKSCYITTSCPAVNYLVETYYPKLIEYLIPVVSPMAALGKLVKKNHPDAFTVFIGPCYSKKFESYEEDTIGIIDAVLTFDELSTWINESNISLPDLEPASYEGSSTITGRSFPILRTLKIDNSNYEKVTVNGMDECMNLFQCIERGEADKVVVEALACRGGCINGPAMPKDAAPLYVRGKKIQSYIKDSSSVDKLPIQEDLNSINFSRCFRDKSLNTSMYSHEDIDSVLKKMGKHSKTDELNCGVCGYSTCREKAIAVLEGMAEINMCIHFIRNKAESITNVVFETSPNAIFTLDEELLVKDFNPASERMFKTSYEEIKDKPICLLMEDSDFYAVKESKESIIGKKIYFPEYDLSLIENIIYLEKQGVFLVIMNDITLQEKSKVELARVKQKTFDAAQAVIEKQMRVAQEIASLLGETTAETKVILTKLKYLALEEVSESK